jgi:hypothetical protein
MTKQELYEARLASLLQRAQSLKDFTAKAVEKAQKGLEDLEKVITQNTSKKV